MKVLQADPIDCNDKCADKTASEPSNQHKLNDIQELLKSHNGASLHDDERWISIYYTIIIRFAFNSSVSLMDEDKQQKEDQRNSMRNQVINLLHANNKP